MENLCQAVACQGLEDHVDVVGHDAPSQQPVSLAVKVTQRVDHQPRDASIPQQASTEAGVQVPLNSLREEPRQALPFGGGESAARLLRRGKDISAFRRKGAHHLLRQRIVEAEGDEVHCLLGLPVWQASSGADS